MNIAVNTLRQWMAKYRQFPDEPFVRSGNLRNHDQNRQDLEQRNNALEEELVILEKALHNFSKDRK